MYIFLYSDPAAFKQPAGDTECRRPTGPPRMQNLPGRVHTNIYVYLYKYVYIYIKKQIYAYVYINIYIYMHIYIYIDIYIYIYIPYIRT